MKKIVRHLIAVWCSARSAVVGLGLGSLSVFLAACSAVGNAVDSGPNESDPLTEVQATAATLAPHTKLYLPAGEGPFPVVIYMHGCKRIDSHADLWGNALASGGFAMLMVDSFTPNDISPLAQQMTVCTGLNYIGRTRADDLIGALHLVTSNALDHHYSLDPGTLDTSRLGMIGFSHGSWTIMDMFSLWSTGDRPPQFDAVDAAVLVYPWCRELSLTREIGAWSTIVPSHFIRPTVDSVVGANGCDGNIRSLKIAAEQRGEGPVSELKITADGHAFDEPDSVFIPFDPEATQQAVNSTLAFLASTL